MYVKTSATRRLPERAIRLVAHAMTYSTHHMPRRHDFTRQHWTTRECHRSPHLPGVCMNSSMAARSPHLRGTSRNMRDSGHNLPSGRFESHWYINDFLGTISPNPAITAKLPGDHHHPTSPPKTPGRSPPPHKSIQNSRALAPISNCRKSKRPSRGMIPTRRARFRWVRCRPHSCTKEIKLPADQASAAPISCRIRWSAAIRMQHQHRGG